MADIVIAKNQTALDIYLNRVNVTVPGSAQITLTDFAAYYEIQADENLKTAIRANRILLNDGYNDLTTTQSLNLVTVAASPVDLGIPSWKIPARLATTGNITLSGLQSIDGYTTAVNDRVLVKNQNSAPTNGIYLATTGAWPRATDSDSSAEMACGIVVRVEQGLVNNNTTWTNVTPNPIILGTTNINFQPNNLTGVTPTTLTKAAGTVGTSPTAAKADHRHDISTAAPSVGIGGANSEGSSASLSRADHNHALRETGGPTDLTIGSISDTQFLQRSGTTIVGTTSVLTVSTASATGNTTTTSGSDVLVNSMTLTPGAGTYLCFFGGYVTCANLQTITCSIYANGSQITTTERASKGDGGTASGTIISPFTCIGTATVAGGQAIEGRWRRSSGTATMSDRSLTLIRI